MQKVATAVPDATERISMSAYPLYIKLLSIYKMPGFPRGLKPYEGLSKGVNIIAGPNASGKSSTAQLIKQLFKEEGSRGYYAEATLEIEGEEWWVRNEEGRIEVQREGQEAHLGALPAKEQLDRYMLAFHELVQQDDEALAEEVAKQAIGGYDPDEAKKDLDYEDKIFSKKKNPSTSFREAQRKREELQDQQAAIQKEEARLEELRSHKERVEEAGQLQELYRLAREYQEAEQAYQNENEKLTEFPSVMEKVRERDLISVQDLEEEIEDAKRKGQDARERKEEAQDALQKLTLPESGIPSEVIDELNQKVGKLQEAQRRIGELNETIEGSSRQAQEALDQMGEGVDASQWEGVSLEISGELDRFLQEAHRDLSEKRVLETEKEALEAELPEEHPEHSAKELENGIGLLSAWLKEVQSSYGVPSKWIWILSVVGVLSVLITFLFGLGDLAWVGLFIGLLSLVGAASAAYQKAPEQESSVRQKDHEASGLPQPTEWTPEQVKEKLGELIRKLQEIREYERKKERITSLAKSLEELEPKLQESKRKYDEWKQELGALPEFPVEEKLKDHTELYYFLTSYREWYQHHSEQKKWEAQKKEKEKAVSETLDDINETFKKYAFQEAEDVEQAESIRKKMQGKEEQRQKHENDISGYQKKEAEQEDEKDKKEGKLKELYDRLELEFGEKNKVREYEEQLKPYQELLGRLADQKRSKARLEKELEEHSLYSEHASNIERMQPDQLEVERKRFEEEASKLEGINDEITEINTKIKHALKWNEIERALAEEDNALDELEELYEANLSFIAGAILVDELKEESQERNKPKVLERATKLFGRITNGAYQLDIGEGKQSQFRAQDTQRGETLDLGRLSTGTRLQLLFAVRLAFIEEEEESSYKLPLLADELLANSDEQRAKAIIEALNEVSKEGRQIFYFTAQADELSKWRTFKEGVDGLELQEYTLEGQANEGSLPAESREFGSINLLDDEVPSPEGHTHQEYGQLIDVPPFDPMTEEAEQLHLWYLIQDLSVLAECLRKRITRWAQLKNYLNSGGKIDQLSPQKVEDHEKKIQFLSRFLELYRKGRSLPIDRTVLEGSGAISKKFMDKATEKLQESSGGAEALLRALRNDVKGFLDRKADELEEFLQEQGYLPTEERMEEGEIVATLQAYINKEGLEEREAEGLIERVLKQ